MPLRLLTLFKRKPVIVNHYEKMTVKARRKYEAIHAKLAEENNKPNPLRRT